MAPRASQEVSRLMNTEPGLGCGALVLWQSLSSQLFQHQDLVTSDRQQSQCDSECLLRPADLEKGP